jgi:hypothetical protein
MQEFSVAVVAVECGRLGLLVRYGGGAGVLSLSMILIFPIGTSAEHFTVAPQSLASSSVHSPSVVFFCAGFVDVIHAECRLL